MRARSVVNAAGVWADDVRALDEGAHPASIRPAKGIHITVPWSKVRNDIAAIVPVAGDRRSVFVVPWGDTTYVGTTDTDYDGPLDDPPCTRRRRRLPARRDQRRHRREAHRVRRRRAPGPGSGRSCARAAAPAPPTSRAGTRCASRRAAWSPSPAASSPPTGAWPPTRSTPPSPCSVSGAGPSRTKHLRLFGGEGMAPPVAALEPSAHEHLTGRYGTEAEAVLALVADDPDLGAAARARPAVPPRRGALRGAPRDGAHARRRALAAAPGRVCSRATPRRAPPPTVAELLAPELGWSRRRTRRAGRRVPRGDRRRARPTSTDEPAARARSPRSRTAVLDRLAGGLPASTARRARSPTASRDWWPLAMIWAHDGTPVTPAAAVVSPGSAADGRRGAARCATRHASPSPPPPVAAACAARACRCTAASCSTSPRSPGIVDVDDAALVLDVRAGTFGTPLEADAAHATTTSPSATGPSRSTSRPSAAGWRAGARASCRPATGRSRTWCSGSTSCSPTAGSCTPAARRVPRSGPTSPSCSSAARARSASSPARACACTRRRPAEVRAAFRFTRFADGLDACRRILRRGATPAVLRLYDAIEGDRHFSTGDDADPPRARRGRPRDRRRGAAASCATSAPTRRRDDTALLDRWLEHRNDVSALEHFISDRLRGRHDGDRGPVVGARRACTTACSPRCGASTAWCWRRRTSRTRTSTARASTSPSAVTRRWTSVSPSTARAWDAGMEATLGRRRAR